MVRLPPNQPAIALIFISGMGLLSVVARLTESSARGRRVASAWMKDFRGVWLWCMGLLQFGFCGGLPTQTLSIPGRVEWRRGPIRSGRRGHPQTPLLENLIAKKLRVSRRNRFRKFGAAHPVNSHRLAPLAGFPRETIDALAMTARSIAAAIAIDSYRPASVRTRLHEKHERTLESPMTAKLMPASVSAPRSQAEHRPTKDCCRVELRRGHVLHDPRLACRNQCPSKRRNQVCADFLLVQGGKCRILLARWRCVNQVKVFEEIWPVEPAERVVPMEFEGIILLRLDVDADYIETGSIVADRSAAGSTAEVKNHGPN